MNDFKVYFVFLSVKSSFRDDQSFNTLDVKFIFLDFEAKLSTMFSSKFFFLLW